MNSRILFALGVALIFAIPGAPNAQQWPLQVPEPPETTAKISRNLPYATVDSSSLLMDVYRPAEGKVAPAIVFYTMYWASDSSSPRSSDWYKGWGRLAASRGIVGIVPDLRAEPGTGTAAAPARALGDDFQRLLNHLTKHASDYGIDPNRIAVFAASGSTWAAMSAIQDPRQTAIKAAVVYYGSTNVEAFRPDLPVFWVRAGLDTTRMNSDIARASSLALAQNVPLTMVNHPTGRHGFEGRDNNATTRQIVEQTFEFVRRATMPRGQ